MMNVQDIFEEFWVIFLIYAILVGLIVGSFLNVVIYRLPVMDKRRRSQSISEKTLQISAISEAQTPFNLAVPRSACPVCKHPIGVLENIPVISWLMLGRRCRHCHTPISGRYPFVELLTALLTLLVVLKFGANWQALAGCLFCWILIAVGFIDFDQQNLPDSLTLTLMGSGLAINFFDIWVPFSESVTVAITAFLLFWCFYQVAILLKRKTKVNSGYCLFMAGLGAWLGWSLSALLVVIAFCGFICSSLLKHDKNLKSEGGYQLFPFGSWLALSGLLVLFYGSTILDKWLKWTMTGFSN